MDFYVVLERPGYRVARRRKQHAKVSLSLSRRAAANNNDDDNASVAAAGAVADCLAPRNPVSLIVCCWHCYRLACSTA
jgi:hypothetical protein